MLAEGRRLSCLAVLVLGLAGTSGGGESYTARTLSCEVVKPKRSPVVLLWQGELGNGTVAPATLCAVATLRDGEGRPLLELQTAAVAVERFGRVHRDEVFRVPRAVWRRTVSVDSCARPE